MRIILRWNDNHCQMARVIELVVSTSSTTRLLDHPDRVAG
jgi:hypothetical protein